MQNYDEYDVPPPKKSKTGLVVGLCVGCGCFGLIVVVLALFIPFVLSARSAGQRMQCMGHEKQIVLAMHNYYDTYDSLPPAYTVDDDGKPLHSWRVLMLPFLEHRDLYGQINLEEPWDSPYNQQFHTQMPSGYICPAAPESAKINGLTSYKWVIGPGTISNGPEAITFHDIPNGLSNTTVLVEVIPSTNWMAPVDIPLSEIQLGINRSKTEGVGSYHPNGKIHIGMCDGACRQVEAYIGMIERQYMTGRPIDIADDPAKNIIAITGRHDNKGEVQFLSPPEDTKLVTRDVVFKIVREETVLRLGYEELSFVSLKWKPHYGILSPDGEWRVFLDGKIKILEKSIEEEFTIDIEAGVDYDTFGHSYTLNRWVVIAHGDDDHGGRFISRKSRTGYDILNFGDTRMVFKGSFDPASGIKPENDVIPLE